MWSLTSSYAKVSEDGTPSLSLYGHGNRPSPPVISSAAKPTQESCCRGLTPPRYFPVRSSLLGAITRTSPPVTRPHPLVFPTPLSVVLAVAGTHLRQPPLSSRWRGPIFVHLPLSSQRRGPIFIHLPCPRGGGDPSLPSLYAHAVKEEAPLERGFFSSSQSIQQWILGRNPFPVEASRVVP